MTSTDKKFITFIAGILIVLILPLLNFAQKNDEMIVAFLDVGQGDATYIRTPSGTDVLIDGGKNQDVLAELGRVMPWYDRHLDIVIATHGDRDHIGGLFHVLENYTVDYVYYNGAPALDQLDADFIETSMKATGNFSDLKYGDRIILDSDNDIELNVLYPEEDTDLSGNSNDSSLVMVLDFRENTFLFTGDASSDIEEYLTSLNPDDLDVDVLKVGHHGSKTSSSKNFLNAVTPELAIISAGKNNQYGHPHQSVIQNLEAHTSNILGTYQNGTIKIKSDGIKIFVE